MKAGKEEVSFGLGRSSGIPPTSSSKTRLPRGDLCLREEFKSGRREYVALDGADTEAPLILLGALSPRSPPTSKKDMRRGVSTEVLSCGDGGPSRSISRVLMSVSIVSCDSRPGKVQLGCAGVTAVDWEARGRTAGAGRGIVDLSAENSGPSRRPRSLTRSVSLPQLSPARGRVFAVVGRSSTLPPLVLPNLNFCFLTPRSRTKEPRTKALETAAAARISRDAMRERNC